jgi:hypothetical protein
MDVIVRPQVYTRYRRILRIVPRLVVEGRVQKEGDVTNLLAQRVAPLAEPNAHRQGAGWVT